MFAKHTTAESTNLFRHERFNENKNKKMKDREIYLREKFVRSPRLEKFVTRYENFKIIRCIDF